MKTTFLDYYKQILEKVSFDRHLMRKEYHKAQTFLSPQERLQLDAWLGGRGMAPDVGQRRLAGEAQNAS